MIWSNIITLSPSTGDRLLFLSLRSLAGLVGILVFGIFTFLIIEGFPAIRDVGLLAFVTDSSWHPTEYLYNVTPMVAATLLVSAGAVLLATPLGILLALFCQYYAPTNIARVYQHFIELLAGIPSVVYGLWGLVVLVPLIAKLHTPGSSLLAGMLILTVMILPIVTLVSQSALQQVPKDLTQNAVALGLTRWSIIRHIILPTAKPGILAGVILQTGRALGETMAVLMVCGNVVQYPSSVFDPIRTLTANIALDMAYATGTHRASLFFMGLLLLLIVLGLVMMAQHSSRHHAYR
ncbi:MAG: phosphate ABC transporter permease subunit PstC [Nitrospirales bacterium]|nr:phosphate ABC transporter permease subunit PstC [Nitrospira sp.]MDR4500010.1 phosphate ABC transporter permease subunit PstC [Nitrospirales bacterium]